VESTIIIDLKIFIIIIKMHSYSLLLFVSILGTTLAAFYPGYTLPRDGKFFYMQLYTDKDRNYVKTRVKG